MARKSDTVEAAFPVNCEGADGKPVPAGQVGRFTPEQVARFTARFGRIDAAKPEAAPETEPEAE